MFVLLPLSAIDLATWFLGTNPGRYHHFKGLAVTVLSLFHSLFLGCVANGKAFISRYEVSFCSPGSGYAPCYQRTRCGFEATTPARTRAAFRTSAGNRLSAPGGFRGTSPLSTETPRPRWLRRRRVSGTNSSRSFQSLRRH